MFRSRGDSLVRLIMEVIELYDQSLIQSRNFMVDLYIIKLQTLLLQNLRSFRIANIRSYISIQIPACPIHPHVFLSHVHFAYVAARERQKVSSKRKVISHLWNTWQHSIHATHLHLVHFLSLSISLYLPLRFFTLSRLSPFSFLRHSDTMEKGTFV